MMLEAIYAWRRNGGMGSPRSERSDAIMDLRAASRNSNSSEPERSRWLGTPQQTYLSTPPPWGSRGPLSAREIDHRFFLPKKRLFSFLCFRHLSCQNLSASRTGAQRDSAYHRVCGTVTGARRVYLPTNTPKARRYALDPFRINVRRSAQHATPSLQTLDHPNADRHLQTVQSDVNDAITFRGARVQLQHPSNVETLDLSAANP
jgi:hypothetical protein